MSLQALCQALHLLFGRHLLLQLLNRLRADRVQEHSESEMDATRVATRGSAPPSSAGSSHLSAGMYTNLKLRVAIAQTGSVEEASLVQGPPRWHWHPPTAKAMDVCQVHSSAHAPLSACTLRPRLTRCRPQTRGATSAQRDAVSVSTSDYQVGHQHGARQCVFKCAMPDCPLSSGKQHRLWHNCCAPPPRRRQTP